MIREHEKAAKDAFLKHQIGKHKHLKLRDVGLSIKKDIPYIGASPDALGICDCCTKFAVECNCPFFIKDKRILDAWYNRQNPFIMGDGSIS